MPALTGPVGTKGVFLLCLLSSTLMPQGSGTQARDRETFTAAVYEHRVFNQPDPESVVTSDEAITWSYRNLRVFREQAKIASRKGADIIVFPENGILGYDKTRVSIKPYLEAIPDPKDNTNETTIPCEDRTLGRTKSKVKNLSCLAKEFHIYIVANLAEKVPCGGILDLSCPSDGQYQFDTNVIFDKTGALVARYRKKYLYWQPMFDSAPIAEIVVVSTPFGTLGTFVAGDIFYQSPALDLVEQHGVDTVVMTTTWDNTFPYPRAVAVQEGYAMRMRVNLLAANTQAIKYEIGGSGIYSSNGAVVYRYNTTHDQGQLLIGTLPTKPRAPAQAPLPPWVEVNPKVKAKAFRATISGNIVECIPLSHLEGRVKLCQKGFCCSLSYSFKRKNENELFVLGVFNGLHSEMISMYTQTCGVFKCSSKEHDSCGTAPTTSSSIIGEFRMSGTFPKSVYVFPYVTSQGVNGTSLSPGQFTFRDNVLHSVDGLRDPLLSAILFGRYYSRDDFTATDPSYETVPPTKNKNGAAVVLTASTSVFLIVFALTFRTLMQK